MNSAGPSLRPKAAVSILIGASTVFNPPLKKLARGYWRSNSTTSFLPWRITACTSLTPLPWSLTVATRSVLLPRTLAAALNLMTGGCHSKSRLASTPSPTSTAATMNQASTAPARLLLVFSAFFTLLSLASRTMAAPPSSLLAVAITDERGRFYHVGQKMTGETLPALDSPPPLPL